MGSIKNTLEPNLDGLRVALKKLSIDIENVKNDIIYIKAGKGIYLGKKEKKRVIVNRSLRDKPLDPSVFGYDVRNGEGLIILLQPITELIKSSVLSDC